MNWFLTFGQRYRLTGHPAGGHPDGWFRIVAADAEQAQAIAVRICGREWSNLYSEQNFDPSFYPKGELRVL